MKIPHWFKCSWSEWEDKEIISDYLPYGINFFLRNYLVQERICSTCNKKQYRRVRT